MSIAMKALATTDFSAVTTGNQLDPARPGAILLHDFREPLGLNANALAMALRLGRYFGTTPQFRMNLQHVLSLQRMFNRWKQHRGVDRSLAIHHLDVVQLLVRLFLSD